MLYYKFQNYEEFKSIFGIQYHGNGSKNRKNKILLAYIKNRDLLHEAVKTGDFTLLHISNIPDLKQEMKKRIKQSGLRSSKMPHQVHLNGETYYSHTYSTDKNNYIDLTIERSVNAYEIANGIVHSINGTDSTWDWFID